MQRFRVGIHGTCRERAEIDQRVAFEDAGYVESEVGNAVKCTQGYYQAVILESIPIPESICFGK